MAARLPFVAAGHELDQPAGCLPEDGLHFMRRQRPALIARRQWPAPRRWRLGRWKPAAGRFRLHDGWPTDRGREGDRAAGSGTKAQASQAAFFAQAVIFHAVWQRTIQALAGACPAKLACQALPMHASCRAAVLLATRPWQVQAVRGGRHQAKLSHRFRTCPQNANTPQCSGQLCQA